MGGQQFASGAVMIDTRPMRRELRLDAKRGIVEADAGIQWPELVNELIAMQKGLGHNGASFRNRPELIG